MLDLGSITVQRVVELDRWVFAPEFLFPAITPELRAEARSSFDAASVDPLSGDLILSVHTWVVRTAGRVILIDSCNGDEKERPSFPAVHRLTSGYLSRLASAGVAPADVDLVMCTHLHPDHVGWNTQLRDGHWAPTFPNATYLIGRLEFDEMKRWYESGVRAVPPDHDLASSWEDSVLPVVTAGQAQFVELGHVVEHELDHGVRLESTPGHTLGHQAVHLEGSRGHALATGDAFHHLLQLNHPDLANGAEVDTEQASATRRRLFAMSAASDTIMLPAHYPAPSAGRIRERGGRLEYEFLAS